ITRSMMTDNIKKPNQLQEAQLVTEQPSIFWRALGNFAVQRPFYLLAAIILYLPLTGLDRIFGIDPPGRSMLGNLFVDFRFAEGFWFGFALFGAAWAVMLTACLNLDGERDLPDRWTYNLDRKLRRVTIPMNHVSTFIGFTLLTLPGIFVVVKLAADWVGTLSGLIVGATVAYLYMDIVAFMVGCSSPGFRALPWNPLPLWCWIGVQKFGFIATFASRVSSRIARGLGLRAHFFKESGQQLLRDDHFFAVFSLLCLVVLYWFLYRIMKPDSWTNLVD